MNRQSKWVKILLRSFIVFIVLFLLLLIIGYSYQAKATKTDLNKYPTPGKLYQVDGRNYHLNCMGAGTPVVILEAGLGESSLSWLNIQPELAKTTKVCSYDRAGFGWSEGHNQQMSSVKVANTLHKLLEVADVSAPYVMVGHSRGGIFVRSFYHQFPNTVEGMVLIDSIHENSPLLSLPYVGNYYRFQKVQMQLAKALAPFGVVRLAGLADAARQNPPLAPEIILAKTAVQNRTDSARAFANEIFIMQEEGLSPTTPNPQPLGNLPLIVLSAADSINVAKEHDDNNQIELTKINFENQKALANLSTSSEWIQVKNSGHYIMWDQPEIVLTSILKVLNTVRQNRK